MSEKALFPVFEVPELVNDTEKFEDNYKPSVLWDIEKGDFILDGAGRMTVCDGKEAFKTWCYKIVQTERFECLAYTSDIGTEMNKALKEMDNEAVESAVERTITEALMVNPRTEYVRDFEFEWDGDGLCSSFSVKGVEWEEIPISVILKEKR